ncbi:MAG: LD-carboxypeptidase [Bacteroidota bacterium]|nr:LD-carboxypeptidase [Bacteroidota bacterium]
MIFPPFLTENDHVRLISPAGVIDPSLIEGAERRLRSWGWQVTCGKAAAGSYGRYSGTVAERLQDLQEALDDPDCKAVFCSRGGYGTVHLIDKIDLTQFKKHPKWLIGYSDITLLHTMLQLNGFASIHGGMAKRLANGDDPAGLGLSYSPLNTLHEILDGALPTYRTDKHLLNRVGTAQGILRGGNLSILYSLRGTPLDDIPEGCILFLEDVGEKPYSVDRMLHNLKLGGILSRLGGLIVGQFSDCEEDPLMNKTVYELIADIVSPYDYPVCFDFPVGHTEKNVPLITGSLVRLSVDKQQVQLSNL